MAIQIKALQAFASNDDLKAELKELSQTKAARTALL